MQEKYHEKLYFLEISLHCTEVRFASLLSGGFITAIVVNPPERKLAKRTFLHWLKCSGIVFAAFFKISHIILVKL